MAEVTLLDGDRVSVGTLYHIGRNYAAHAAELGNQVPTSPLVFLKARSAVRGLAPSPLAYDEAFHHEVELVLLLGEAVPLGARAGWEAVRAVGVGLDLTRREVQARCKEQGLPWTAAKSFAGSAVVGPLIDRSALGDPAALRFGLEVNGEVRQQGEIGRMIFPVPTLLGHLASMAPLEPGDLVYTGTPEGVGPIRAGDRFRMWLAGADREWGFDGVL